MNPQVAYTDEVVVRETIGIAHTDRPVAIGDLRERLLTPPENWQEVKRDVSVDLTAAGAKFVNAFTVPAGAIIKFACMHVTTLVVAGGTTTKLSLNANAAAGTADYIQLATLTKNTKLAKLFADATPLASNLALDVCGMVSALNALGDTNFSAGVVRVIVTYFIPNTPSDV